MRSRRILAFTLLLMFGMLVVPTPSSARTAAEIDAAVSAALNRFYAGVKGSAQFVARSRAVLVFPGVVKVAFVIGGQYGEGALRIPRPVTSTSGPQDYGYYSITGGSWGASIGIQKKDLILVFRDGAALRHFESASGWQVGVDGAVTLINVGVGADLSTMQVNQPIVAFVVGQKGLMFDVSLQGAKISRIKR